MTLITMLNALDIVFVQHGFVTPKKEQQNCGMRRLTMTLTERFEQQDQFEETDWCINFDYADDDDDEYLEDFYE